MIYTSIHKTIIKEEEALGGSQLNEFPAATTCTYRFPFTLRDL